jgi:uncharacterized membrane protein YkvA (DUF1232 family)
MAQTRRKLNGILALLNVHQITRVFLALMADRRVSMWYKASACCGLVYIFSPLDVIPDFITGIGFLDDIIVSLLIMQAFIELAPLAAVDEVCARLRIDQRKIFFNVPRAIGDALEMYEWGLRGRERPHHASGPPPSPAPAPASRPPYSATREPEQPAQTPPYGRYSVFRGD